MAWPLAIECLRRIAALGAGEGQPSSLFTSQEENCAGHAVLHVEQRVQKRLFFQSFRDESFPEKLRTLEHDDQAGFLFALGNLALLDTASVGICGSRHATAKAMDIARETVRLICNQDITIISGYAAGVDQMAHRTALAEGGKTIIVLPEGLINFSIRRDLKDVWEWERVLVLTQFGLTTPWRAWNAMKRNRTIMGLSDAMLVVEARSTGGTLDAGKVTLKYGKPLFAVDFSDPAEASAGNKLLIESGAQPLQRNKKTGDPSVDPIVAAALNA